MRHILYAAAAVAVVAISATWNHALSQAAMLCRPGGACATGTTADYNRCVDLALRRGLLLTKDDPSNLERFNRVCLSGSIPR